MNYYFMHTQRCLVFAWAKELVHLFLKGGGHLKSGKWVGLDIFDFVRDPWPLFVHAIELPIAWGAIRNKSKHFHPHHFQVLHAFPHYGVEHFAWWAFDRKLSIGKFEWRVTINTSMWVASCGICASSALSLQACSRADKCWLISTTIHHYAY